LCEQSQTETNYDGGARKERQRLVALVHTGPECCWRLGLGVFHMAGRMAGLFGCSHLDCLGKLIKPESLLLHQHGSGPYVPLPMTMKPVAMSYGGSCPSCSGKHAGFADAVLPSRIHISEAEVVTLNSCWLHIIRHSFVFSS